MSRYKTVRRFSEEGRAAIRAREARKLERVLAGGFMAKVDSSGGSEACWTWMGTRQTDRFGRRAGYGYFQVHGKVVYVHRRSLEIALGRPLGPRMEACHTCDNPPCCNPAHLFEGTHADNVRDMVAKGRQGRRGFLTDDQVRDIRRRLAEGESQRLVGLAIGVARSTVASIAQGRHWKAVA